MSLIAWYPLNGDSNDYSGNARHLTNNNVTYSNNGKIGKAPLFGANNKRLFYNNFPKIYTNFSWSCWMYLNTETTTRKFVVSMGRDYEKYGISIAAMNNNIQLYLGGNTANVLYTIDYDCVGKWTHIALTSTGENTKVYVNGAYYGTCSHGLPDYTYALNSALVIGKMSHNYTNNENYFPFNGMVNDVRIYDHILSQKEISEIVKAKILHYNFNAAEEEPTTNILNFDTTFKSFAIGSDAGYTNQLSTDSQIIITNEKTFRERKTLKITHSSGNSGRCYRTQYINYTGKQLTFSMYVYSLKAGAKIRYELNGGSYSWERGDSNLHTGSGWEKLSITTPILTSDTNFYGFVYPMDNNTIYISSPQLEVGDHATAYTPSSRSGVICDCSGYRNHIKLTNNYPSWTDDTTIGSGAYIFSDSKFMMIGNKCKPVDMITVSAWAYRDNWQSTANERIISCTENGGWSLHFNNSSGKMGFLCYADGDYRRAEVDTSTIAPGWHMITGTFNGLSFKLYIDGILKTTTSSFTTSKPITYHATNGLVIGAEASASENISSISSCYWNGKIADIQIYATPLSDADILALYQTKGSVSKAGQLFVNEIVEGKAKNSITKKCQLETLEISEIGPAALETKTEHGVNWVRVFYHNNVEGTRLFSSDKNEFLRCNTEYKKSDLWMLEEFRGSDGKFEFLLQYESGGTSYNRWKQSNNFTSEKIAGYEEIQCSWTSNYWGGLEYNGSSSTWTDGSVNHGNWFYAIGAKAKYDIGIPKWSGAEAGWVELWVRCENPQIFKMYKDGTCQATEFIEV